MMTVSSKYDTEQEEISELIQEYYPSHNVKEVRMIFDEDSIHLHFELWSFTWLFKLDKLEEVLYHRYSYVTISYHFANSSESIIYK